MLLGADDQPVAQDRRPPPSPYTYLKWRMSTPPTPVNNRRMPWQTDGRTGVASIGATQRDGFALLGSLGAPFGARISSPRLPGWSSVQMNRAHAEPQDEVLRPTTMAGTATTHSVLHCQTLEESAASCLSTRWSGSQRGRARDRYSHRADSARCRARLRKPSG